LESHPESTIGDSFISPLRKPNKLSRTAIE
jgi:hypothetical protein